MFDSSVSEMKVIVFGGQGQLGQEIFKRAGFYNLDIVSCDLPEVDITDCDQILRELNSESPTVLINCAAYTQVDLAEHNRDMAFKVNRDGAANLAVCAKRFSLRLIHLSTDYVFAGDLNRPLNENDLTEPLSIYGQSKLAGEEEILSIWKDNSLVVRTASLHGKYGPNFVATMLKLFQEKSEVKVVSDQYMSPTWAGWLAEVLLQLVRFDLTGVLHVAGAGVVSWFEFARYIFDLAASSDRSLCCRELVPCLATDFPRSAKRPAYSALDCSRLQRVGGIEQITWQDGLRMHLNDLGIV